ncbi:MAG: GTPase HflX [Methermicoccaceae archaeon]
MSEEKSKTAVLVLRNEPSSWERKKESYRLKELEMLANAAGYNVVDTFTQVRHWDRRYHIGYGKVRIIAEHIAGRGVDTVIFHNKLTTMQLFNLSKQLGTETIDRFHLILEIFARRAKTRVAKLQVEFASLSYELPKAREKVAISKKREHPGFMGFGSYENSYEQDIRKRIAKVKEELGRYGARQHERRKRETGKGLLRVALCGYTNAGKSTLLNVLSGGGHANVSDQLFTTLSPTTRRMNVGKRKALITDTVGFIEDLPHFMIEAFRSTFSEIYEADLVLLVVDASESAPSIHRKLAASHATLFEDISDVPIITVFNKIDIAAGFTPQAFKELAPNPVMVSAKRGDGLDELKTAMSQMLPSWREEYVELPMCASSMSALSLLYERGVVERAQFDESIKVRFRACDEVASRLKRRK